MTETWRKSSYSGAQEGSDCVELAPGHVRDSKNQQTVLTVSAKAMSAFVRWIGRPAE